MFDLVMFSFRLRKIVLFVRLCCVGGMCGSSVVVISIMIVLFVILDMKC